MAKAILPLDVLARGPHYIDHIAPIWKALPEAYRGLFYVPNPLHDYAKQKGIANLFGLAGVVRTSIEVTTPGTNPLLVASYGDLLTAVQRGSPRPYLFMEHGVGITFPHPGYAGGKGGVRDRISLFLDPNEHTRLRNAKSYGHIPGVVIGTPKLDRYIQTPLRHGERKKPVVAISFHWAGNAQPEAGNAAKYYLPVLKLLARSEEFTLIAHGHPKLTGFDDYCKTSEIPYYSNLDDVLRMADVYVNDSSSTLYEAAAVGLPVVVLNCPAFRRNQNFGIRFWEHSDIGPNVERPEDLKDAILQVLANPDEFLSQRQSMIDELYPHLGDAAEHAADSIVAYLDMISPEADLTTKIQDETVGLLYMAWGEKAAQGVRASIASLRALGLDFPACVVGDTPVSGASFIPWKGESPFDKKKRPGLQFRAGRVKPLVCAMSPFQRTLYIDADTEFLKDPTLGFELLSSYDVAIAREVRPLGQLYNEKHAGWEINIQERDTTIEEIGKRPDHPFYNTGVIFFRKNMYTDGLFELWHKEWMRFQEWDEQMAFLRATKSMQLPGINLKMLNIEWNHPHREQHPIIFHNYGRGVVRQVVR